MGLCRAYHLSGQCAPSAAEPQPTPPFAAMATGRIESNSLQFYRNDYDSSTPGDLDNSRFCDAVKSTLCSATVVSGSYSDQPASSYGKYDAACCCKNEGCQ